MPAAIALCGMPSYSVDLWFLGYRHAAFDPDRSQLRVPSLPAPESTLQMVRSRWSRASDLKKKSIGTRWRRCRFHQLQCAVQKGHVRLRRDRVGAVRPHHHIAGSFENLHAGNI
jgi:hypothetical protein